jgi:hypothetical protein
MISMSDGEYRFEEAAYYVMDKNKELYQRFSPDWNSPLSDTIKDILGTTHTQEDDYHAFVQRVADHVGWEDSPQTIYDIFDGKEEMYFCVADFLAKELGSTSDFWIKRSEYYRLKVEAKKKFTNLPRWEPTIHLDPDHIEYGKIFDTLERILFNCLSSQVKREDAPCSSETHLNTAIALLIQLVPDYNPQHEDMKSALEWAIEEGRLNSGYYDEPCHKDVGNSRPVYTKKNKK